MMKKPLNDQERTYVPTLGPRATIFHAIDIWLGRAQIEPWQRLFFGGKKMKSNQSRLVIF